MTSRETCRGRNGMSGEHYSLCRKNVQVFPSKDNGKFPSGASRPFCWLPLTVHCLTQATGIHELHVRDRSSLYGSKLAPLSKRDLPLSLTLHGAVSRVTLSGPSQRIPVHGIWRFGTRSPTLAVFLWLFHVPDKEGSSTGTSLLFLKTS